MKNLIFKVVLVLILGVMFYSLMQTILIEPIPTYAVINNAWGDSFVNSKGASICVCDEIDKDCYPCLDIVVQQ